jgi:hypothetical protein
LQPDGTYVRVHPAPGEAPHRAQEEFLAMRPTPADRTTENGSENGSVADHILAPPSPAQGS